MTITSIIAACLWVTAVALVFVYLVYVEQPPLRGTISFEKNQDDNAKTDLVPKPPRELTDVQKHQRFINLTKARRILYRRNDSGFGNQSGGLVAVWTLANATGRVFLYDMPMLDHVIDYAAYLGITTKHYQQLLRETKRSIHSRKSWKRFSAIREKTEDPNWSINHFDHYRDKEFVKNHTTLIETMLIGEEIKVISMVCPRVFSCTRLNESITKHPVIPISAWDEAMAHLMRPSQLRSEFRQMCATRFQDAGLDHDLVRDDCRSNDVNRRKRMLVVLQVRYNVDASEYKRLGSKQLKLQWKHNISQKALAGLETLQRDRLAQTHPSMIDIYITADDVPFLLQHYEPEMNRYGRLNYPRNERFRQTSTGNSIPICDWYVLGNADYALVSGTSFSYSALLRCSHSLQAFDFKRNNSRFDKSIRRW